jgi:hypothetical protein
METLHTRYARFVVEQAAIGGAFDQSKLSSSDATAEIAARVAARLTGGLAAGDILLMHDGNSGRRPGGPPVVVETLQRVLDRMVAAGLGSAPLHELVPSV